MKLNLKLTHKQLEQFEIALLDAYRSYDAYKRILRYGLNKKLQNIVGEGKPLKNMVYDLLEVAEAENWLGELLIVARKENPDNLKLQELEEAVGIATREISKTALEAKIKVKSKFYSLNDFLTKLNQLEKQICRIKIPLSDTRTTYGTGFLVAPDILLTNYHVVKRVIDGAVPASNIELLFDYKKWHPSQEKLGGSLYRTAENWLIDHSPYSSYDINNTISKEPSIEELDYALIRLERKLEDRGFIKLPKIDTAIEENYRVNAPLYIIQHPEGKPLKIALETESIIQMNDNKTRVYHQTLTETGSSGSPCFNADLEWIALHHSGEKYYKNGSIPITALVQLWKKRGLEIV